MLSDPVLSSMIILELSNSKTLSKQTVQQIIECSDLIHIPSEDKKSIFASMFNNVMNFITSCKMKPDLGKNAMQDVMNHACDILEYDKTHNNFYADLSELQIIRSNSEHQSDILDKYNTLIKTCETYVKINLKEDKFLQLDFANMRLKELIKFADLNDMNSIEVLREQTIIVQRLQNETEDLDQRYQIRVY